MKRLSVVVVLLLIMHGVQAQQGLIAVESPHDVSTTMDKLTAALESKGMTVFGRINHAENAQKADLSLLPTELLIFGNPKVGTPLMNCAQTIALDLPQKMLAWQDESGQVYLGWNDPSYLKTRHAIEGCDEVLERVNGALASFADMAISE